MTQAAHKPTPAARTAAHSDKASGHGRRTQVRDSGIHGKGVYAVRPIQAGERVLEYKGEIITWEEALDVIRSGKMLAYFVNADGSKVILNQLGTGEAGQELMSHKDDWPKKLNTSRLLRMHGANGERYRYLAAVAPVIDADKSWIVLMAKKAKTI